MKHRIFLIISTGFIVMGVLACRTENSPKKTTDAPIQKKYEYPLQLPELFESRLSELGVTQEGIAYLKAVDDCSHWGGEPAYDAERSKQIEEGMKRDCDQAEKLGEEFKKSKPDEKSNEIVSKVVEDIHGGAIDVFSLDYFIWQDPEQKSQVMKSYSESRKAQ